MLSHFASSTSVLRSPSDPIVLLYMDWGIRQDSEGTGRKMIYLNNDVLTLQLVLCFVLSIAQFHLNPKDLG